MSAAPTPTWRWLVVGLLFAGLALYLLVNGEIGVDKQRTMLITRVAMRAYELQGGVVDRDHQAGRPVAVLLVQVALHQL